MLASEVVNILANDHQGFNIGGNVWTGTGINSCVQYHRRFPDTDCGSVHYEVVPREENPALLDVAIHIESHTDSVLKPCLFHAIELERNSLSQLKDNTFEIFRSRNGRKMTIRIKSPVACPDLTREEVIAKVEEGLNQLYGHFEPIINKVAVSGQQQTDLTLACNGVPESSKLRNVTNEELVDNVLATDGDPFPENCSAIVVTVEKLLRMNLRIPEYQRPYKWTRRSVEELMQDIRDSLEVPDGPVSMPLKYRLGTVILDASSTDGTYEIVDGQQRILTLLLINRILNDIRKNKVICPLLEDKVTMRVLSRSRISRKNLHENYAVVKSCLAKDYELRKKLIVAFNSTLEMVVVKVNELSEAFQLFDSQNTRGRALDPHDLLKAFHLRAMAQKAKAQNEDAGEEMRRVVTEWEAQSEESLRSLFDNWLFRISNWSRKRRTHPFSAADIHEFKGVPFDSEYSFALRAKAAMPRDDDAASRRFQIGEDFEEGREFFRMVSHYLRMVKSVKSDALFKDRPEIKNVLKLADGKGFSHVENMFRCALMSYVDRFGEDALVDSRVIDKLCLWAFILRLDMNHVSEDTVNKYAVIEGGADYTNTIPMFSVIKTARTPSDIAIQDVCGVNGSRYKRKQGVKGREQLQNALKKVEA